MNKANIGFLVVGIILLILAISLIVAISEINKQRHAHEIFYNKKFIPAMVNVSDLIPQGYPVVVSHPHSYLKYFINHDIVTIPKRISSEKSLLYYMVKRNLKYLLVYDNRHYYPLDPIFSGTELKNLRNDYSHLASYVVDDKTRFQIYQMNKNWKYSQ